ncbi:MAG: peptide deformylase [Verrucomicrobiota bacterium]
MILQIVKYGNPVLRKKGARVETVNAEIRALVENMLETMRAARGVGLAAQQIGQAVQIAVLDVRGVKDRPSRLELNNAPAEVEAFMPVVLINPEIKPLADAVPGPEGCLSFPELFADIFRPESVEVRALNAKGESFEFRCGGLLARAVQHEVDHLNGILFIDRMSKADKDDLKPELDELQAKTKAALKK